MLSLAEKIKASKRCCQTVKEYIAERKRKLNEKLFSSEGEVFVIKRDEKTGEYVGKFVSSYRLLCSE